MKRTLEDNLIATAPLTEAEEAAKVQELNARHMAQKLYQHFHDLYNHEAMYAHDETFIELTNPVVRFDWDNVGLSLPRGEQRDIWHLSTTEGEDRSLSNTKPCEMLEAFFKTHGSEFFYKHVFAVKAAEAARVEKEAIETLTQYFLTVPLTDLVIETWGDDSPHVGGKIGHSTNYEWIKEEQPDAEKDSDAESNGGESIEEEDEGNHPSASGYIGFTDNYPLYPVW